MNFRVEPVNEHGKDPAVMVTLGDRAIILPPFAAREVAIRIIEAAEMAATGEKLLWNVQTTSRHTGGNTLFVAPDVSPDYWAYRVQLSDTQAIVGFPKYGTIGIGFAREQDWNTNLPCSVESEAILQHIRHNKGDDRISDADCLEAIRLIRSVALPNVEVKRAQGSV